jgi:Tfp pilus assembly protein PilF
MRIKLLLSLLISISSTWACAAGGSSGGSSGGGSSSSGGGQSLSRETAQDPVIRAAQNSIAKEDWADAQALLKKALETNPNNADYHNLYAYSTRKGANPDMALVFAEYAEALRINPKHRGALEYLGEAYLQVNNVAKAKEQLAALDKLCTFGCEEYSDLKRAVKQYDATHTP